LNLLGSGRLAGLRVLVLMEMVQVRIMRILVQKLWAMVPVAVRIGRRMIVLAMDAAHVAVRSTH
jgi:hypothetical protein